MVVKIIIQIRHIGVIVLHRREECRNLCFPPILLLHVPKLVICKWKFHSIVNVFFFFLEELKRKSRLHFREYIIDKYNSSHVFFFFANFLFIFLFLLNKEKKITPLKYIFLIYDFVKYQIRTKNKTSWRLITAFSARYITQ